MIKFTTPIQQNQWINAWLKDIGGHIELYNFRSEGTTTTDKIETAYDKLFPKVSKAKFGSTYNSTNPQYSMDIYIGEASITKTYYTETAPLDLGSEIVKAFCQYDIDNGLVYDLL